MPNDAYRALADPTRRGILRLLREREMTAGEIAVQFQLAKPTLSGHFAVLREAGLISSSRSATTITYRLNVGALEAALMGLMDEFRLFIGPGPASRSALES